MLATAIGREEHRGGAAEQLITAYIGRPTGAAFRLREHRHRVIAIDTLGREEFDELAAAMAIIDQRREPCR